MKLSIHKNRAGSDQIKVFMVLFAASAGGAVRPTGTAGIVASNTLGTSRCADTLHFSTKWRQSLLAATLAEAFVAKALASASGVPESPRNGDSPVHPQKTSRLRAQV